LNELHHGIDGETILQQSLGVCQVLLSESRGSFRTSNKVSNIKPAAYFNIGTKSTLRKGALFFETMTAAKAKVLQTLPTYFMVAAVLINRVIYSFKTAGRSQPASCIAAKPNMSPDTPSLISFNPCVDQPFVGRVHAVSGRLYPLHICSIFLTANLFEPPHEQRCA
jgi:hypothetical protein